MATERKVDEERRTNVSGQVLSDYGDAVAKTMSAPDKTPQMIGLAFQYPADRRREDVLKNLFECTCVSIRAEGGLPPFPVARGVVGRPNMTIAVDHDCNITITMPCGREVVLSLQAFPMEDLPCPCGDPFHVVVSWTTIPTLAPAAT